jgi:hypothetical protein
MCEWNRDAVGNNTEKGQVNWNMEETGMKYNWNEERGQMHERDKETEKRDERLGYEKNYLLLNLNAFLH